MLGGTITAIGAGTFAYCNNLTTINLNAVTAIGDEAFFECTKLATVEGIGKVKTIGANSFAYCSALTSLELTDAEVIGNRAFFNLRSGNPKLASVTFGANLKTIGDEAFAENPVTAITIPASVTKVGTSAFSGTNSLTAYTVAEGNKNYVSFDGVLYRYIDKDNGVYELCAYPAGKYGERVDGSRTYTVEEGTVTIGAYAFYGVAVNRLATVVFPYTLKAIGDGAFFASGISTYKFTGIVAPVLLEGINEKQLTNSYSSNSFYYNNFNDYLAVYAAGKRYPGDSGQIDYDLNHETPEPLTILYPSNGTGYDNYVYTNYFNFKTVTGEQPDETSRQLKDIIAGLPDADTVKGWKKGSTDGNTVEACAKLVKQAHALYNGLSSDYQKEWIGQTSFDKLFAVEAALTPVKAEFGIGRVIDSVSVYAGTAHKSEYRVGEKFSLKNLKLLVTYDDYTEEVIDANGNFKLVERFDRALRITDESVDIAGEGAYADQLLSILITVTEGKAPSGSLPAYAIALIVLGCVAVLAATAVVTLILLKKNGVIGTKVVDEPEEAEKTEDGEEAKAEDEEDGEEEEKAEDEAEGSEAQSEETEETEKAEENGEQNAESEESGEEGKTDD